LKSFTLEHLTRQLIKKELIIASTQIPILNIVKGDLDRAYRLITTGILVYSIQALLSIIWR
jgi:hypothetical protein